MNKIILMPDSFKGTMSSKEICEIMQERILHYFPDTQVISVPVADGGEGSVDAFLSAMDGELVKRTVKGPYMQDMEGFYGLLDGGKTAVIEMAACAGLPLVGKNRHPDQTTTYGVGQLIEHAIKSGVKKVVLGLGGSATNDMGAGCAAALGVRFINAQGESFIPVGGTLSQIKKVDISGRLAELCDVDLTVMCDIDNPLYGEKGAAYIFGPQKGADEEMVKFLDAQLRAGAKAVEESLQIDYADMPGAGAAGGMGYGVATMLCGKLQMGIETVLETVGFATLVQGASFVLTGEGRIDSQSLRGKVVVGVGRAAKKHGVPVIAIVGDIANNIEPVYDEGVCAIFSINRVAVTMEDARPRARSDMKLTIDNLMRFIQANITLKG